MVEKTNLKIHVDKCNFKKKEIGFVGHILKNYGLYLFRDKIKVIQTLQLPRTKK